MEAAQAFTTLLDVICGFVGFTAVGVTIFKVSRRAADAL